MNFNLLFVVLCVLAAVLYCLQNRFARASAETPPKTKDLQCFQRSYLSVYFCAVMGDWLQGPYVYALYAAYDFSRQQIALLFIVGFGASGVLGTFAGQVADKYGRRLSCQVYFILYIASCLTKHSSSFYWLLLGRLTGGVATSILFSCFESWLIAEHNKKGFPAEMLEQTLSASTLLNYTTAVVAAWLGAAVRTHFDSLVAPFDLAVVFLALGLACMTAMWGENKGETSSSADTAASYLGSSHEKVAEALAVLRSDKKIVLIGAIQSCFEAAMYIFVFMWTPKLESLYEDLPHGQVFGCFMACCMIGSSLVNYLIKIYGSPVGYMCQHLVVSCWCLFLPALFHRSGLVALGCFFIFEAAVGIYWPSMALIKSRFVPEHVRATVYNIFRVPLNLLVISILANLGSLSDDAVFWFCGLLLAVAALLHHCLQSRTMGGGGDYGMDEVDVRVAQLSVVVGEVLEGNGAGEGGVEGEISAGESRGKDGGQGYEVRKSRDATSSRNTADGEAAGYAGNEGGPHLSQSALSAEERGSSRLLSSVSSP